jgi:hypothetical protein
MVHERFQPDPAEDLRWGARTAGGRLPAALATESGPVSAPGAAPAHATVYGGAAAGQGVDAAYQIDRLTTRPEVVRYDDPFSPSVAPFKRLFAFDRVGGDLQLAVSRTALRDVPSGGSAQAGEDTFFGDVQVDLLAGKPARIPSVGPGARLLALHADPAVSVRVQSDGAGNWFAVGDVSTRVRLLMQLSVPRAVFGSAFPAVGWAELENFVVPLPARVHDEADRVLARLNVSRTLEPARALGVLVAHFRSFAPSAELPEAPGVEGLYEELALAKKGVCRHRSYAFLLTALRLGLPARFVHNEAHAWVEVFDGKLWHRIDLGGAAGRVDYTRPPEVPLHRPPRDDLPWPVQGEPASGAPGIQSAPASFGANDPNGSSPGSRTAPASLPPGNTSPGAAQGSGSAQGSSSGGPGSSGADRAWAERLAQSTRLADAPPSEVTLDLGNQVIRRGHPLRVQGRLSGAGKACPFGRVDFALRTAEGRAIPLGSLPTDERGVYAGEVVVPPDVPVGDHSVQVASPGAPGCGPSR